RTDDDRIQMLRPGMIQRLGDDLLRLHLVPEGKHRNVDLPAYSFELVDCRRAVYVARHKQRFLIEIFPQVKCKLTCSGRLTGTLQTDHHDDSRRFLTEVDLLVVS